MSFNIKSRSLADTTVLHLVDPETGMLMYADDKETKPLTIELYGRSSKQYRTWLATTLRKQEQESKMKKKAKSLDEQLDDNADFLATVSVKASNFDIEGVAIDSKEMFKKLYADPSLLWIGEQVTEKLSELSSFL